MFGLKVTLKNVVDADTIPVSRENTK